MASSALTLKKTGSEGGSSESGAGTEERGRFEFFGWVYHFRVNSIGHEYYHLRFLFIRGKYVEMYKRDPREYPDIELATVKMISSGKAHGGLYFLDAVPPRLPLSST